MYYVGGNGIEDHTILDILANDESEELLLPSYSRG